MRVIALLLIAGIAATVLIAWTCALTSRTPSGCSGPASIRLASNLPAPWAHMPRDQWNNERWAGCGNEGVWRAFGTYVEGACVIGRDGSPSLPSCSVFDVGSIRYEQCGWPWRCLECYVAEGSSGTERYVTGGLEPPAFLRRKVTLPLGGFGFNVPYVPALPIRPIWTALLLDWAFFSFSLWAVFVAPGQLRRYRRDRSGLCINCAYDLRATPSAGPCPECGRVAMHAAR